MNPNAKRPRRTAGLLCLMVLIFLLLYLFLGALLPNVTHASTPAPTVTEYTGAEPGGESVAYITDNTAAMELRLALIESAREEIVLSTFDFDSDQAGQELLAALYHAAGRGVRVKVLVDGLSGWMDLTLNGWFQALASQPGAEIRVYNPINPFVPWQMMYRLHDKYLIIDQTSYLLGGRNSTDLFLGDYNPEGRNVDSEVYVSGGGDSLAQLTGYFRSVWALDASRPYLCNEPGKAAQYGRKLEALYLRLPETYPASFQPDYLNNIQFYPANRVTLLSNPVEPENRTPTLWGELTALMAAGDDVLIHTPYVILSEEMRADLAAVCQSNTSTTLILNDPNGGANLFGCSDYRSRREDLLATGITLGEYLSGDSMHTKNVLIDDRLCVVGSFNFDMRSAYLDTELMLVIDSAELNARLRQLAGEELTYCNLATAAGETPGANYAPVSPAPAQRLMNQLLRQVIKPIRCLL